MKRKKKVMTDVKSEKTSASLLSPTPPAATKSQPQQQPRRNPEPEAEPEPEHDNGNANGSTVSTPTEVLTKTTTPSQAKCQRKLPTPSLSTNCIQWRFWGGFLLTVVVSVFIGSVWLPYSKYHTSYVEPRWPPATIDTISDNVNYVPDAELVSDMRPTDAELEEHGEISEFEDNEWEAENFVLLNQYDSNGDGYLSPKELEPLTRLLREANVSPNYDVTIDDSDEVVSIRSYFKPLQLDTMTMNKDPKSSQRRRREFRSLKSWTAAARDWQNFAASEFSAFLPANASRRRPPALGRPYHVVEPVRQLARGAALPIERYKPLRLARKGAVLVHRLLAMFHENAFVYSRFTPQGGVACVRAYNDEYVDIVFRLHAEFQLNEPPLPPFWFTPAQFTGSLVMRQDASRITHFHLYVPSEKRLNVDMEWLSDSPGEGRHMEVDIGHMSQLELRSTSGSVRGAGDSLIEPSDGTNSAQDWTEEISWQEATRRLEVQMYPFMEVPYHNLTAAFSHAAQHHKLVHSVVLWGALDDQSC